MLKVEINLLSKPTLLFFMGFEEDVDFIVEFIKEATIKKFGQEIDLIAIYGSRARGTHEPRSDLEMFVVVEDRKKTNAEWFFLHKDIPVDLWTMDWKIVENAYEGTNVLPAGTISTCDVIYYKDEKSKIRFGNCREKLKKLDQYRELNLENANKLFNDIYKYLGKIYFAKKEQDIVEARNNAWLIIISIAIILAKINNRYFLDNWGTNMYEAKEFAIVPNNLISITEKLASEDDFDKLLLIATQAIDNIRTILIEINEKNLDDEEKGFLGTEVSTFEFLNKIRKAARHKDIIAASYAVHDLQASAAQDLWVNEKKWTKAGQFRFYNEYKEKYNYYGFPDFTSAISSQDFYGLIKLADIFEETLRKYLNEKELIINDFTNLDELKSYLNLI